jgi:hypothetical protein
MISCPRLVPLAICVLASCNGGPNTDMANRAIDLESNPAEEGDASLSSAPGQVGRYDHFTISPRIVPSQLRVQSAQRPESEPDTLPHVNAAQPDPTKPTAEHTVIRAGFSSARAAQIDAVRRGAKSR